MLFRSIDTRKLGTLIDRVHRELTDADLQKIVTTYHAWRGEKGAGKCNEASLAFLCANGLQAHHSGVLGQSESPVLLRESLFSSYRAKFPKALAA